MFGLEINTQLVVLVAGLILSNAFAVIALLDRRAKRHKVKVLEQGLVPLKYFEQLHESQAGYITTLETRIAHILALLRQSELRREELEAELEQVKHELATKRRELNEALQELERFRHDGQTK